VGNKNIKFGVALERGLAQRREMPFGKKAPQSAMSGKDPSEIFGEVGSELECRVAMESFSTHLGNGVGRPIVSS
jgi:hypothetical protein